MFQSMRNFCKRHAKKIAFAGVVAGGVALAGYYIDYKLKEAKIEEEMEELRNARMRYHFDSNQKTCNATVQSLLPTLKEELESNLDCDALVQKLKSGGTGSAEERLEVWKELKIIAFTRAVCGVYVFCFLVVFLRVQLNVIGRYMYIDSMDKLEKSGKLDPSLSPKKMRKKGGEEEISVSEFSLTPEEQKFYLLFAQYSLRDGLTKIIECVQRAVKSKVENISLKEKLSEMDLRRILDDIRFEVESDQSGKLSGNSVGTSCFWTFVFPGPGEERAFLEKELQSEVCLDGENSSAFGGVLEETRGLLQNTDFTIVLENCLNVLFNTLMHNLDPFFKEAVVDGDGKLPLAKIVPLMTGQIHSMFETPGNASVDELSELPILEQYSAIIYTSFEHGGP
eukprot:Nk52_evm44s292 gene=Nk52_evmTU44s292